MGLFGSSRPKFGAGIVATPEQEEESRRLAQQFGLGGAPAMSSELPVMQQPQQPAQQQRWIEGGKFGGKDALALALAAISDVAAQRNGYEGDAMSGLLKARAGSRDLQQKLQLAQQQRMQERDEWKWRQDYERANPMPSTAQPYRWEDNAGNVWERRPDGTNERIFTDTVPKMYVQGDQAVQINNPYATAATAPAARATPPAGAIEMLQKNPALAPQFDAKYGAGASAQFMGGGGGNVTGGFPNSIPSGSPLAPFRR